MKERLQSDRCSNSSKARLTECLKYRMQHGAVHGEINVLAVRAERDENRHYKTSLSLFLSHFFCAGCGKDLLHHAHR